LYDIHGRLWKSSELPSNFHFSGYPKSLVVTLGELLFDGFALKIVYDFLKEIKTTPTGDVPFEVMKNETV